MTEPVTQPVYLIDASIFIFRAYHTVPNTLTDPAGQPVNAVHGFMRFIGDLIEQLRPQHIAVAFDEHTGTHFRHALYPAYKANRDPTPLELKRQFAWCRAACESLGLACFGSANFEADDLIGTLTAHMRAMGRQVVLISRDKDLSQLIRPGDIYWDFIANKRYHYADIPERFGVRPERMACFLALTGDAVDNIQGVPGIGRKTAALLLHHFESLTDLYANLERVFSLKLRQPGFVVGQLRDYQATALLARQLTEIVCHVPLDLQPHTLHRTLPKLPQLNAFYNTLGFGRLLRAQAERIAAHKHSPLNAHEARHVPQTIKEF